MAKKELTDFEKRCTDCVNCEIDKSGVWHCTECFGQLCNEIDDCPEGVTMEDVKAIEELDKKNNKFKLVASAEDKPKRKPRERKADDVKRALIETFKTCLEDEVEEANNIVVTNIEREIEFLYGDKKYKLTLSAPRS